MFFYIWRIFEMFFNFQNEIFYLLVNVVFSLTEPVYAVEHKEPCFLFNTIK